MRVEAAGRFTERAYAAIAEGHRPQRAVVRAQRARSRTDPVEDWAPFTYIGVP
ncbi:hypothetical protein ACFQHO_27555 [Actinomadura yumaensis]|uniref:hypothetical protein n=1 Tax=Actinomadura yumaensis TaxID=111807 RepID=UPI00361688AF